MMSTLIDMAFRLISRIPLPLGRIMGKMLGRLIVLFPASRTKVSLQNIKNRLGPSLGPEGAKRLNREMILHFAQMIFEVPHILNMNRDNLNKYMILENEHNLQKALKKEKGAFILTGHLGNWEFMAAALSLRFSGLSIVARPFDFRPLDRVMHRIRSRFGAEIIPKQKAMRRLLAAIKQKRIVGILLDQNVDWYAGVFVKFLGEWACTNTGLALLALRTGTPVVPAFSIRRGDGRYRIVFEEELRLIRTGDKQKDVEENTALFTNVIESYIKRYPEQWLWFHKRWKTRPFCVLPT